MGTAASFRRRAKRETHMNTNKTVIDSRTFNTELLNKAQEAGLLSVLIAPTQIRLFLPTVVVQYAPLPADKTLALASTLRFRSIPFAAADKALKPTINYIPAEHLRGEAVVEKIYPPAKPATRPVMPAKAELPAPAPAEAKAELPPVEAPVAQNEQPAKKEKKPRAPRAPRNRGKKGANVVEVSPEGGN